MSTSRNRLRPSRPARVALGSGAPAPGRAFDPLVVDEAALRARVSPTRGLPALDLPTAVALVRDRHGVDFALARARAGISRGHLLDVVLELPGGRNAAEEGVAAEELVRFVLGEARAADWIGSVASLAGPRGGLLQVVQPRAGDGRFFPLAELVPAVEAAIQGVHAGLAAAPLWTLGGEQRWYLFELDVEAAAEYPGQADVALVSTFMPELVKCFLAGAAFASTRFSRVGELFLYLKYVSVERDPRHALARRRVLEDALDAALVSERAGRVIGGGMGVLYSYVNFACLALGPALEVVRDVAARVGLSEKTWIQFFDSALGDAWVSVLGGEMPPPGFEGAAALGDAR